MRGREREEIERKKEREKDREKEGERKCVCVCVRAGADLEGAHPAHAPCSPLYVRQRNKFAAPGSA